MLLSFASYGTEAAVADVHDQDLGATQVSSPESASPADQQHGSGGSQSDDSHPFHVCHCSHTHAGVLPVMPGFVATIIPLTRTPRALSPALHSIYRAPPLRPPIA